MEGPVEELEKTWELCQKIDFSPGRASFESDLLEPTASLLDAETAVFRVFSQGIPRPTALISLGIDDSVHDAYLNRYFKLDPTRRLLTRCITKPVFSDHSTPGRWSDETAATGKPCYCSSPNLLLPRHLYEFHRFHKEFLLPNNLYHHVAIRFQDPSGYHTFALDYTRPKEFPPFGRLEYARAKVVTMLCHARTVQLNAAVNAGKPGLQCAAFQHPNGIGDGRDPCVDNAHSTGKSGRGLSSRELEVAETVALGLTNKEVSDALSISVRTVENHIRSIFAKLKVNTRTRLAAKLHEVKLNAHE